MTTQNSIYPDIRNNTRQLPNDKTRRKEILNKDDIWIGNSVKQDEDEAETSYNLGSNTETNKSSFNLKLIVKNHNKR